MICQMARRKAGTDFLEETADLSDLEYFHGYSKEEMEQMADVLRQVPGMTGEVILRGI